MKLQSDKGGELGNGIEDLLEDFIPRFTEIVESAPLLLLDDEPPATAHSNGSMDKSYVDSSDHVLEKVRSCLHVCARH